ncbi:hypothetical protein ACZ87_02994 [Candidatus Erwinia dacicola]|uniref:Uncharacterized protein n=1 Tax=Candidatus Erwinia dacicola TaxID=252393 RepID=A0A328TMK0_9GAMM|nr:hypothetical protein ACZ87_02994 [Candidatus Erwinia dacicola]
MRHGLKPVQGDVATLKVAVIHPDQLLHQQVDATNLLAQGDLGLQCVPFFG